VAVEKIIASSSEVTSVTKVFSLLTTTARASVPMRNSSGVRLMALQDSISLSLIAREALEISVSPLTQKRSNPAPEPMLSMVISPLKPSSSKRCYMRSERGNTVEEPAETMAPLTASGAYIAIGSATVAVAAGASVTTTALVGTAVGAAVGVAAGAQAAANIAITNKTGTYK
jgi:hypothetical protein